MGQGVLLVRGGGGRDSPQGEGLLPPRQGKEEQAGVQRARRLYWQA